MIASSKVRTWIACFGLAVCFTGFSWRLVHLQVCKHDEYSALAAEKHVNRLTIYARRGVIQDANRELLATDEPVQNVVADGSLITDPGAVADLLAQPLGMDARDLRERISTDRRYVVLKRRIPESVARQIENRLRVRSLRGIAFEPDAIRIYPNGPMLCHVLGFLDSGRSGIQGIEKTMDQYLRGRDGFRFTERDRKGKELVLYRGQERPARDGCNVRLTIDMCLQNIVETELDAACAQFKPKGAVVILMRPKTGEILAMANRPNFDPNKPGDGKGEQMKNAAVIDMMEPGSTFKIVTAAAGLNEHLVKPDTYIFCENGYYSYGGRPLRDHHPYADLTWTDILVKSSNIGAAKIAMKLEDQRLYEYIRRFGFGERTGIALPGEIPGVIHPPHRWSKISITRIPMGHEVDVTPIQIITAMAAIANGGKLMMPQIVRDIVDEDGTPVASFPPVEIRTVVSTATATAVTEALKGVVSARGTAALAKVYGFSTAGKTGTAQKVDPKGGYTPGKYIVSFCGYLPADKPEFVGLVMFDDAQTKAGENYGGLVAAPVFSRIAEKAARYLNLTPEPEPDSTLVVTQASQPQHQDD